MKCLPVRLVLVTAVAVSCSDDPAAPVQDCPADTGVVDATITAEETVTIDWTPNCAIALLLVELDASDQWVIVSPDFESGEPALANTIFPPVTYGAVPAGAIESQAPAQLVVGQTYDVALWRIVAPGSTAPCVMRFEDACMLANPEFVR